MSAKKGSAHSRYAGLLPIEPSEDFFRAIDLKPALIDLKPEPIDLKPEDVPLPNLQPSARKRPRPLARIFIVFCTGLWATWLWQSYGDAAREMIASLSPQLGWLTPRPALTAQNAHPPDVIAPAAPSADLDVVGRNIDEIAATIAAGQEPTRRFDQIATAQEQMTGNTGQTATSVDQAPAAKTSGVTVESPGDAPTSQPVVRLDTKPTEENVDKIATTIAAGQEQMTRNTDQTATAQKPMTRNIDQTATSIEQAPVAKASNTAVESPGDVPTSQPMMRLGTKPTEAKPPQTLAEKGKPAVRPKGSDHRRVGTAENRLSSPPAPRPQWWALGLP